MSDSKIRLTATQTAAVEKALGWYYFNSYYKHYFIMLGPAGSGKSFLVKYIVEALGLPPYYKVLYCTLTGKAALRLRMAGNEANTIHKTFYNVYRSATGQIRFSKKKSIDPNVKLIVIDEFSMVDNNMLNDILSFRVPTILIGDHFQLPPIFGTNRLINDLEHADVILTEIMRQEDSSGILDLAFMARNMQTIYRGNYKKCNVLDYSEVEDRLFTYDMVICWKNETRFNLNSIIRKQLGYTGTYPNKGEKVLALRNNYDHSIRGNGLDIMVVNGLLSYVLEDAVEEEKHVRVKMIPDFFNIDEVDEIFDVCCFKEYFQFYDNPYVLLPLTRRHRMAMYNENNEKEILGDNDEYRIHLDFGYAGTCHRNQGLEYPNVLVIDEYKGSEINYFKWLYTAITRAKKSVDIALI